LPDKRTVLLIDNNAAVVEIVRTLLERNGCRVKVLSGTSRVLDVIAEDEIDLIVSDVNPPAIDGFELARRVKADPAGAEIPMILLTALSSLEDEFEGYLAGADAYLTKPFRARDLLAAVDHVLEKKTVTTSSGRLSALQEVARVLAVVPFERRKAVESGMRKAGFELDFESGLTRALQRIDRERFHLLICETGGDKECVRQVREFLEHFAMATPVIFIHPQSEPPQVSLNDPQFKALALPVTPADLAEAARKAVLDFGGLP